MIKKLFASIILAAMILSAVSCGSDDSAETTQDTAQTTTDSSDTTETENSTSAEGDTVVVTASSATALEVLNAGIEKIANITSGTLYAKPALDSNREMAIPSLCSYFGYNVTFGSDGMPAAPEGFDENVAEYALYKPVAGTDVMEIDVIKFNATASTDYVDTLCQARMSKIKSDYESNKNYDTDGTKKKHVDAMKYEIYGEYAIIVCAESSEEAFTAAKAAIDLKKS